MPRKTQTAAPIFEQASTGLTDPSQAALARRLGLMVLADLTDRKLALPVLVELLAVHADAMLGLTSGDPSIAHAGVVAQGARTYLDDLAARYHGREAAAEPAPIVDDRTLLDNQAATRDEKRAARRLVTAMLGIGDLPVLDMENDAIDVVLARS